MWTPGPRSRPRRRGSARRRRKHTPALAWLRQRTEPPRSAVAVHRLLPDRGRGRDRRSRPGTRSRGRREGRRRSSPSARTPRGLGAPPSGARSEGRRAGDPAAIRGTRPTAARPGRLPPRPIRAASTSRSAWRAAASAASSIAGSSWRPGARWRRRTPCRSVQPGRLDDPLDDQRDPLALGAVDEEPEGVVARHVERQVPEVDRERHDRVTAVADAVRRDQAVRAGDLGSIRAPAARSERRAPSRARATSPAGRRRARCADDGTGRRALPAA